MLDTDPYRADGLESTGAETPVGKTATPDRYAHDSLVLVTNNFLLLVIWVD